VSPAPPGVLMVTGDFPPDLTGVGDYTQRLIEALAAAGTPVRVLTGRVAGTGEVRVPGPALTTTEGWGPGAVKETLRALDRCGPRAVIHFQYPGLAYRRRPTINLLPALIKLLRPRARVVVTMHEFRVTHRRWRLRALPMLLAADAIVLVDPLDRPMVAQWTRRPEWRIRCIPLGTHLRPTPSTPAEITAWRSEVGLPGAEPIAIFFGGVYEHKGVLDVISSVRGLRATGVPARLLLVGAPEPGAAFADTVERSLADAVRDGWARWLQRAPPELASRCLQLADVAVLPFRSGAMANRSSMLTALAHGLPTITTRTAATPPEFGPSTGMLLVDRGGVAELRPALGEVLTSEALRAALRAGGLAYARGFSWDTIAGRTLDLYRALDPGVRSRVAADR
jgi:glycosyltransferase involved in cell wall biosynthesis